MVRPRRRRRLVTHPTARTMPPCGDSRYIGTTAGKLWVLAEKSGRRVRRTAQPSVPGLNTRRAITYSSVNGEAVRASGASLLDLVRTVRHRVEGIGSRDEGRRAGTDGDR